MLINSALKFTWPVLKSLRWPSLTTHSGNVSCAFLYMPTHSCCYHRFFLNHGKSFLFIVLGCVVFLALQLSDHGWHLKLHRWWWHGGLLSTLYFWRWSRGVVFVVFFPLMVSTRNLSWQQVNPINYIVFGGVGVIEDWFSIRAPCTRNIYGLSLTMHGTWCGFSWTLKKPLWDHYVLWSIVLITCIY